MREATRTTSKRSEADDRDRLAVALPRNYEVQRMLGRGAQKSVFLAHDRRRDELVAVALMHCETGDARAELRSLSKLGAHPHIAELLEVHERRGETILAMQYLPGGDLAARLALATHQGLPLIDALRCASQIARALAHAHAMDVVHGDLKPANVLFDAANGACITDFGMARSAGAGHVAELTGTPWYLPPEALRLESAGPAGDLYSLGCVLYEMLVGRPPFDATSAREVLRLQELGAVDFAPLREARLPAPLLDLVECLLEKQASQRPQRADDVACALDGMLATLPASAPGAVPASPTAGGIAGPARALTHARTLLGASDDVRPRALRICGAAGLGKSLMLDEIAEAADKVGCAVLRGGAVERLAPAYQPFRELLQPWAARFAQLGEGDAERLRVLVGTSIHEVRSEQTESDRASMFSAVASLLRLIAKRARVVVLIDDLQWADPSSLSLFARLARAGDPSLRLFAAHRPAEAASAFAEWLGDDQAGAALPEQLAEELDAAGVRAVLEAQHSAPPSAQLVQLLLEASGGNPLFLEHLCRHMQQRGALAVDAGALVCTSTRSELELPPDLPQAITAQASQIPLDHRRLLRVAAHIGMRFELGLLCALVAQPAKALLPILHEAREQGLLEGCGALCSFAHPVVRSVLYGMEIGTASARVHLRIAEELLAQSQREPVDDARIAGHLIEAGDWAEPDLTLDYTSRAGDRALAACAWPEAGRLFEAAARAAERVGPKARSLAARFHRGAAWAHMMAGDDGPNRRHLEAALQLYRTLDETTELVRTLHEATRAATHFNRVGIGQVSDEARQLESLLGELDPGECLLRARVLGSLSEAHWLGQQEEAAERYALEAIALGRKIGDETLLADVFVPRALSALQRLELRDAIEDFGRSIEHAKRANHFVRQLRSHQRACMLHLSSGELAESERHDDEARRITEATGERGDPTMALSARVGRMVVRGQCDEAELAADEALAWSRRSQFPWTTALLMSTLATNRCQAGRWADAQRALRSVAAPDGDGPLAQFASQYGALVDALGGETPDVDLDSFSDTSWLETGDSFNWIVIPDLALRVELADLLGLPLVRPGVARGLDLATRRGFAFAVGWPFFLPRIAGVAATLRGDFARAEQRFEEGLAIAGRERAIFELARTHLDYARMLSTRNSGGGSDRSRARRLLEDPALQPLLCGGSPLSDRSERLLDFLRSSPPNQ